MIRIQSRFGKFVSVLCVTAMVNLAVPMGIGNFVKDSLPKSQPKPEPKKAPKSRVLTAKDMRSLQGSYAENPYLAGQSKWDIVYKGVNIMTGNFTTGGTDLSFEGGYGIPVNVTRSYSSNNGDEGPLGKGWTLSVDVRSTAGGLLKSPGAPIRGVPIGIKERPSIYSSGDPIQVDPMEDAQPLEAVVTTDSSGKESTVQKDVDGVLTTPLWDKNEIESEYEVKTDTSGNEYSILVSSTVLTPEGTTYVYEKKGYYPDGMVTPGSSGQTPVPGNVLKIVSATDRHGNVTEYTYSSSSPAEFKKSNGMTIEDRLTSIEMPGGREFTFTWGTSGAELHRIVAVSDGTRTVDYGYTSYGLPYRGYQTSVETPEGKVTQYRYAQPFGQTPLEYEGFVIDKITDPRGLETLIYTNYVEIPVLPYDALVYGMRTYKIVQPNGIYTYFKSGTALVNEMADGLVMQQSSRGFQDRIGAVNGDVINQGMVWVLYDSEESTLMVSMHTPQNDPGKIHANPSWQKFYNTETMNLIIDAQFSYYNLNGDYHSGERRDRGWTNVYAGVGGQAIDSVTTVTSHNFLGSPLESTTTAVKAPTSGSPTTYATSETEYAYWGADKYHQQKATRTRDSASTWRYSYTDYYDKTASTGKGLTYRVYDPKNSTIVPGTEFRADVSVTGGHHSAEFTYDAQGRATDVEKLQKVVSGTPTYVTTHSIYGADGAYPGTYGNATDVYEDFLGFDRRTQTLAFDATGKAIRVQDAAGRVFETVYNLDGEIQSVTRTDTNPDEPIVTYTYNGGSASPNAARYQVATVTDELSGVVQSFTYTGSGGGMGQPASITEEQPGVVDYTMSYTYNSAGDRETSTTTVDGTISSVWKYTDYLSLGTPESAGRAFQTVNKQQLVSSAWVGSSEEFHYYYDSNGRIRNAAFAQSPQTGSGAPTSAPFYTDTYPAASRAEATYDYTPSGQLQDLQHSWYTDNSMSSGYDFILQKRLLRNAATYNAYTGLKEHNYCYEADSGTPTNWGTARQENFGYDALNQLTLANYGDGGGNHTWSYDAAANRNDATAVDNLNRATVIGGVNRAYDILGNTTSIGTTKSMTWDVLNRMTSMTNGSITWDYTYRADGMRVQKQRVGQTDYNTYRYDGQMPIEDYTDATTYPRNTVYLTKYGLGARGIDYIERLVYNPASTLKGFPVYDAHGNMIATLMRTSGNNCSLNDMRAYDAWGGIRSGATTGDPAPRHSANLGHVQDDESGLVYMRARYYDASAGRFISEDIAKQSQNWYVYCKNSPTVMVDESGNFAGPHKDLLKWLLKDLVYKLLKKFAPDDKVTKTIIAIIDACFDGMAAVKANILVGAIGDAKTRAAAAGLTLVASVMFFAIAYHQLCCLFFMYSFPESDGEDFDMVSALGDVGRSQGGFNIWDKEWGLGD